MAKLKLFFIFIILSSFASSSFILAQRKIQLGRNEIQKSKYSAQPKKKKVEIERKRERPDGRKKAKKTIMKKKKDRIFKDRIQKRTIPKKYNKIIEIDEPEIEFRDVVYYDCFEEAISPYPNFPLVFSKGEIIYLYSREEYDNNNITQFFDIYKLRFTINVRNNDYLNTFAVLVNYYDGTNQLEIFNEEESLLYWNNSYTFSKDIALPQSGYVNLRIGYYNSYDRLFYPEKNIPNKTDLLVYIER